LQTHDRQTQIGMNFRSRQRLGPIGQRDDNVEFNVGHVRQPDDAETAYFQQSGQRFRAPARPSLMST
jgi:hypothetical protein